MRLPFHLPLPAGRGRHLYFAKKMGRPPALVRGHARGLVEWAIPIPNWTPYLLLGFLLGGLVFLGWSAGLLRLHATATLVQAAKPSVRDSVRDAFDSARGYTAAGDWNRALASTSMAVQILEDARSKRQPMSGESFDWLMAGLDGIALSRVGPALQDRLMHTRIVLAEYRSALEPAPLLPDNRTTLAASRKLALNSHTHIGNPFLPVVDGYDLPTGAEFFLPPAQVLANGVWVEDLTMVGGTQTLDGIHWRDAMFINARIRYLGGELELRNVRFVNCTFEIAPSARGENVARYITLDSAVLALD